MIQRCIDGGQRVGFIPTPGFGDRQGNAKHESRVVINFDQICFKLIINPSQV